MNLSFFLLREARVSPNSLMTSSITETPDAPLTGTNAGSEAKKSELQASLVLDDDINRKMVWGLYAVYAAIGTVNGFFATYLATPTICQGIFGPLGESVTISQCNVAPSVFQMSWNFKLFLGFILDNVSFFGSRRRGWILFGWTGGLVMLAFNAIMVDTFIDEKDNGGFEKYLYSLMGMCCFYTFSDVAGDGLIIEVSKFEPDDRRGYILTTCQMIRFTAMLSSTVFGLIFMSGSDYQLANDADPFELPFELPYNVIHWCLLAAALPSYVIMWLYLKDPPVAADDDHHAVRGCAGMGIAFGRCWQALQSYAVFMLLVQVLGLLALAGMQNPALQPIAMVASPSSFQNSLGASIGNLLFVIGVWLFRKYLLTKNWRYTLVVTYGGLGVCVIFGIMIVNNTFGFSQNGWFYMFQNAMPQFIQGLSQVLSCLAVIEISPPGLEATIYELLISSMNGAQTLGVAFQSAFAAPFNLDDITGTDWAADHCSSSNGTWGNDPAPICHTYAQNMTNASYMTLAVNLASVAAFVWFMPRNAAHCREWAAKTSWQNWKVGCLNLVIFVVPFAYANVQVILDVRS